MRLKAVMLGALCLGSCHPLRVGIADISTQPERWRGRDLIVQGLVVYEFENLGIYASYADYCAHGPALYVEWDHVAGITRRDNRRMAVVAGELDDRVGTNDEVISTGKPGPGPLKRPRLVRWLSEPLPPCAG